MKIQTLLVTASACLAATLMNASSAQAQLASDSFSAVLLGGNECDAVAPPAGPNCRLGDADAFGRATVTIVNAAAGQFCATIQVDNLAGATAAHIHAGRETVNGAIVVPLPPPVVPGAANPGASSFCGAMPIAVMNAIRANPSNFYVNVHNAAFPGGAIRGQLF
jgi:hypothetical protein